MFTAVTTIVIPSKFEGDVNPFLILVQLLDCPTLNSTDVIVVNMSSTAVGSTATYQCRDGPTDVYTTQCTSIGDWDPLPLSTLDCTESNVSGQHCMCLLW